MKKIKTINPLKGKINLISLSYKPIRLKNKRLDDAKKLSKYIRKLFDKGSFFLQEQCILLLKAMTGVWNITPCLFLHAALTTTL